MKKKTIFKKCGWCGKAFETTVRNKKHCCIKCEAQDLNNGGHLCWTCQNYAGKCLWSAFFIPIRGWEAIPITIEEDGEKDIRTYKIKFCPLYNQDLPMRVKCEI